MSMDSLLNGDENAQAGAIGDALTEAQVAAARKLSDTQAQQLIEMASEAELFHDLQETPYTTFPIDGHTETCVIDTKTGRFRAWLRLKFYAAQDKPPMAQALKDALETLAAQAQFHGKTEEVHVRVGGHEESIYLDLCNDAWQFVRISPWSWEVVTDPPIKFRRPSSMEALPVPMQGGSLQVLRQFLNIGSDDDWRTLIVWLLAAFRPPTVPFAILVVTGEQGSAKSTLMRVIRANLDPYRAMIRSQPRSERDMVISANSSWVLAFDNLSHIHDWLSDALCRVATGSGFQTRQLYTDTSEIILSVMRPIMINSIVDVVDRGDLRDRSVTVNLPRIKESDRQDEEGFWAAFYELQPFILGALLTALSDALAVLPNVKLDRKPRMADFATWGVAVERALKWREGSFLKSYEQNRNDAIETFVQEDRIATLVRELGHKGWTGTAAELLITLNGMVDESVQKLRDWPKSPKAVGSRMRRLAPGLLHVGTDVNFIKSKRRLITIEDVIEEVEDVQTTCATSATCADPANTGALTVPVQESDVGKRAASSAQSAENVRPESQTKTVGPHHSPRTARSVQALEHDGPNVGLEIDDDYAMEERRAIQEEGAL